MKNWKNVTLLLTALISFALLTSEIGKKVEHKALYTDSNNCDKECNNMFGYGYEVESITILGQGELLIIFKK